MVTLLKEKNELRYLLILSFPFICGREYQNLLLQLRTWLE